MSELEHEPSAEDWEEAPASARPSRPSILEPSVERTLADGTMVGGRYRVVRMLGSGGFGQVYLAEHVELQRKVALKVLHAHLTSEPALFGRFQQEARTAANVGHPNIVQVFDLGRDEHGAFIAMELLEGEELEERIQRDHPLPESFVARIGAEIADAIAAAHERGVIHRDLKPENVFLAHHGSRKDVVKVIDFGIAKLVDRRMGQENLTHTGQLLGTPRYMAPEQLRASREIDARVDVYALGALLHRALTRSYAFDGSTYPDLLLRIVNDPPAPIRAVRPDVSDAMIAIVERALAKDPDGRFASAQEIGDALRALAGRATSHVSHPPSWTPVPATAVAAPLPDASVDEGSGSERRSRATLPVLAAGALAVIASIVVALAYFVGPEDAPMPAAARQPAERATSFRLAITTTPEAAEIVLDGEPVGTGRFERELPRDGQPHRLTVRAQGYAPTTLVFTDDAPGVEHISLEPLPSAEAGHDDGEAAEVAASDAPANAGDEPEHQADAPANTADEPEHQADARTSTAGERERHGDAPRRRTARSRAPASRTPVQSAADPPVEQQRAVTTGANAAPIVD